MVGPVPPSAAGKLEALLLEDVSPQIFTLAFLQRHGPGAFRACVQDGTVAGVVYVGEDGLAIPAAVRSRSAAVELGQALRANPPRRLLGADLAVAGILAGMDASPRRRTPLRLHEVTPDEMGPFVNPDLRQATGDDLPALLRSFETARREASPSEDGAAIEASDSVEAERARLEAQIRLGHVWMVEARDEVAFRIEVEAEGRHGAHLGHIYTHPAHRQQGLASLCVGQLARHMLARLPRLSAFVPSGDDAAKRVVRNVGFGPGTTWSSASLSSP